MTKTRKLVRELLSLINKPELNEQEIARVKDLICYLSEARRNDAISADDLTLVETILYTASIKLRTFGYNRLNGLTGKSIENDSMDFLRDGCIAEYYKTETGFTLDRMQKLALDTFELGNKKLFLSAPTSFGKTFLLKEIIYRNRDKYNNIVIVLPTVALLMEVTEDLSSFFKQHQLVYDIHNSVYRDLQIGNRNVFILTPERVLRLLALYPALSIDFFFYDEIYKIDEDIASDNEDDGPEKIETGDNSIGNSTNHHNHRAVAFRLALYFLLRRTPSCYLAGPFIKLSSLKSGFTEMLKKYKIYPFEVHFEPTMKAKIDYHTTTLKMKTPFEETQEATGMSSKKDKLAYVVQYLKINKNNPAIVFCLYPGFTEKYARAFCEGDKVIYNSQIQMFIDHIKHNFNCRYDNRTKSSVDAWDFLFALSRGIGIHNGKFPKYFQREIMSIFNQKQLSLLFCTSTIVEGVNTNAKTVIVYNNPSGENPAGRKFLLLNINGRAGRYLKHFVGNIVYLDSKTAKIEGCNDISLDFKIFSKQTLLSDLDLENVLESDLSPSNRKRKQAILLNRQLLPDEIFSQNRLVERKKQERILSVLCKRISAFKGVERVNVFQFINNGYFDEILRIWAAVGEIKESQILAIKYFSKKYAEKGYLGVLQYRFDQYDKMYANGNSDSKFVNETYRAVFRDVKDTIEYQLPRILSLFETLINQAFFLVGTPLAEPLDLSKIIRYFEIGAKTFLGTDMIEKGVPIITVRKIERASIIGETFNEQLQYFLKNRENLQKRLGLDTYEKLMLERYCSKQ